MPRAEELITSLLDRGYAQAVAPTLAAITRDMNDGVIAQRTKELLDEASRLDKLGKKLTPDNAILRAAIADAEDVMKTASRAVDNAASKLQSSGINAAGTLSRQLAVGSATDAQLASIGVRWNTPDPEAVNAIVQYTSSQGWQQEITDYGLTVPRTLREIAVRGVALGQGPLATARQMVQTITDMPLYRANTTMRTLQLQSYRDTTAIHQAANADILQTVIRIAVLDSRVCLCCLAEHGTELKPGERVLDHHNGRCSSVGIVKWRPMPTIQTGPEWFAAQTPDKQLEIAGPGALEALTTGRASFDDFVQPYEDQVFGEMMRESTLTEALKRS